MSGWDSWQSTWAGASGPLPDIRARARLEAARHRRTSVTVLVLASAASLGSVPAFAAPEGVVHAIGLAILAFGAAMGIGFLVIQRGVGSWRFASPREALGFLERRLGAELRVARLVRWVYLGMCLFGGIATQVLYAEHGSPLTVRLMTVGCFLVGVALAFLAPWWFGRIARHRQAELDRWRGWMDDQNL